MTRILFFALVAILVIVPQANASDLEEFYVRSVEWLTHNSSLIVVANYSNSENTPTVERVLKGNQEGVDWPLKPPVFHNPENNHTLIYSPPSDGNIRLLFIAGSGRLLQSVRLDREQQVNRPAMHDVLYGVDQFGNAILSQSELFKCVIENIATKPVYLATRKTGWTALEAVSTPPQFSLKNNGDCYYLVVPFTQERQKHFVDLLADGDASERFYAISQLANFIDESSWSEIEAAAELDSTVAPSYQRDSGGKIEKITAIDVAERAKDYLKVRPTHK